MTSLTSSTSLTLATAAASASNSIVSRFPRTLNFFDGNGLFTQLHIAPFNHSSRMLARTPIGDVVNNSAIMGLGGHLKDPGTIFDAQESRIIQIIAVTFSACSIVATLTTIYWFFMMRRNFRRHLILLLIIGDLFKSTWYFVFAIRALMGGGVSTASSFCQADGFLIQASVEACDVAILMMSMHMYLQIFYSTTRAFGHDGLYRYRHCVLVLYLTIPALDASLAFINPGYGYISQGPFCTLPIRPFWYRLALSWIPRYLIWVCVMTVALRIYMHVGQGFRVFARHQDRFSTGDGVVESDVRTKASRPQPVRNRSMPWSIVSNEQSESSTSRGTPLSTEIGGEETSRGPSVVNWSAAFTNPPGAQPQSTAEGEARRDSRILFQSDGTTLQADLLKVPPESNTTRQFGLISTISSLRSMGDISVEGARAPALEPISEMECQVTGPDQMSADTPLKQRRRAIQRQLRLLFIYPCVYMLMWTIPLVYHCMNYNNHYAQHPVFVIGALATFSQVIMGSIDCAVFGWREKPWERVRGSDGTFLGSFMFWRFNKGPTDWNIPAPSHIPMGLESSIGHKEIARHSRGYARGSMHSGMMPTRHKRAFSGLSDRADLEAERAAERLALERAERGNTTRENSLNGSSIPPSEWWDRRFSTIDIPQQGAEGSHSAAAEGS